MPIKSFLYKIKKGKHYSNGLLNKLIVSFKSISFLRLPRQLNIICNFTDSCKYVPKEVPGQINKLYGTYCLHPYYESARFGWRSNGSNKIEIFSFVHSNSFRNFILSFFNGKTNFEFQKLGECSLSKDINMYITVKKDRYIFKYMDDKGNYGMSIVKRRRGLRFPLWLKLFPYFGGKNKAPHDIKIYISDVL